MSDWISETLYANGALKNKLGITDEEVLSRIEMRKVAARTILFLQKKPRIKSLSDLKAIHEFYFYDLYDWVGKYRWGNMHKGQTEFMECERFDFAEANINNQIYELNSKKYLTNSDYAKLLDNINFMHPFREGNGRSTRLFLQAFAANHSQFIDYFRNVKELIKAESIADIKKLLELITVKNLPNSETAFNELMQSRNSNSDFKDK